MNAEQSTSNRIQTYCVMIYQYINIKYLSGFKVILHTFRLFINSNAIIDKNFNRKSISVTRNTIQQSIILPVKKKINVNMLRLTEASNKIYILNWKEID